MTGDVPTAARVTDAIIGNDSEDPVTARATYLDEIDPGATASLAACSFAIPEEFFGDHVDPDIADRVRAAVDTIADAGAAVEEVSIPAVEDAVTAWDGVTSIEFAATFLNRWAPVGRRTRVDPAWHDAVAVAMRADGAGFGDIVKRKAVEGAALLDRYGNRCYVRAHEARVEIIAAFETVLADHDALLTPTMPLVAPEFDKWGSYDSELPMAANTRPVNVTGMPAVTVPAGRIDGLPVGLQVVGDTFADADVLRIGRAYEKLRDG
jgi:amidase/aspartyl-tRNA(Asn)/glutamyl-tRNA(Gln) amidotransferase subunit A